MKRLALSNWKRFALWAMSVITVAVVGLATTPFAAAQGSWATVIPMPVSRFDLAVVTAPDGRIYVAGGSYTPDLRPLNHVEAYDPGADNWVAVAPMRIARGGPAAAVGPNGLIYVFGGHDRFLNPLNTVEAYNPSTDAWTLKAPMPTARFHLAAAAGVDGRIYVVGG
jgi:N-acetylneuraminic acid mutarotase